MDALLGPGISPWVSARVGLPHANEAGLTYTGRSLRLDGRHAFSLGGAWALSLGLGASAVAGFVIGGGVAAFTGLLTGRRSSRRYY